MSSRVRGNGCPRCAGKIVTPETCLAAKAPDIAAQWDATKNGDLRPDQVHPISHKKVWWKCPAGPDHEWRAAVGDRVGQAGKCPFCIGQRVSVTNSLQSLYPKVAATWHPHKNGKLTPARITAYTNRSVWWLCDKGADHEWRSAVYNRTKRNAGCPFCTIIPRSRQEILLAAELASFFEIDLDDHKVRVGRRLRDVDIKISENKLIIEFDGSYWHRDKQMQDEKKTKALERAGWRVIRARERPLKALGDNDVVVPFLKAKRCADLVLKKIEVVTGTKIPGLARYLKRKTLANEQVAEAYIDRLLARQVSRKQ